MIVGKCESCKRINSLFNYNGKIICEKCMKKLSSKKDNKVYNYE